MEKIVEEMLAKAMVAKIEDKEFGRLTQFVKQGYDIVPCGQALDFLKTITKEGFTVDFEKSEEVTIPVGNRNIKGFRFVRFAD